MLELIKSAQFDRWLSALRDRQARARIQARLDRYASGNPGDVKALGGGIAEMRIDYGPGYRVYFTQRGQAVILLLCGGDKRSQSMDVAEARRIAELWTE